MNRAMEVIYKYWDMCSWMMGRVVLWILIVVIIALIILWLIEQVLGPICEAIRDAWWRWTTRCPNCGSNKHD